jgi:hypothetical protein
VPHIPQLLESVRRSLHVQGITLQCVPQSVFGDRQLQWLPSDVSTQLSPCRHLRPQPPQFAGSIVVLVQTPEQSVSPIGQMIVVDVVLDVGVVVPGVTGAHSSLAALGTRTRVPN